MTESGGTAKKGCAKRGCFGCLIVGGAGIGLIIIWTLVAVMGGGPDPDLPDGDWVDAAPGESGEFAVPGETRSVAREPLTVDADQVGYVVLDVGLTSFSIVPAPAGTPIKVDARYDDDKYELEESMQTSGELGWVYRLSFDRRSLFDFRHEGNTRVTLHLPAGTPIKLEGRLGTGESDLDLGGLWIESVDLDVGIGEHKFDFDEPLPAPMSRFEIRGSIGETRVSNLGNASPSEVYVNHRIGEFYLDLDGAWTTDADVTVRCGIGECRVGLPPEQIGFEVQSARVAIGEANKREAADRPDPPPGAPVVRLKASHSLGELYFAR